MRLRTTLAVAFTVGLLVAGCGAAADGDGSTHADNPHNPNPTQGLGSSGGSGAPARDMPGGGRGSTTPRGK